MFTISSYLRALKKAMIDVGERARDVQERKNKLVEYLKTNYSDAASVNALLTLIAETEIPLVNQIRTDIQALISQEEKIIELAKRRGLPLKPIEILFRLLKKGNPLFKSLHKTLKKERNALARGHFKFFLDNRFEEEQLLARIERLLNVNLHSINFNGLMSYSSEARVATLVISASNKGTSMLRRVAAVILLTVILALSSCAKKEPKKESFVHTVRSGQNFSTVYQGYRNITIPYNLVIELNKKADPNFNPAHLRPGQNIIFTLKEGAKPPVQKQNKYYHPSDNFRDEAPAITFARCIFGEAEGCNMESKMAIGAVVVYRMWSPSFPNNVHDVILTDEQFSCFNKGDPQKKKIKDPETYSEKEWKESIAVAQHFLHALSGALKGRRVEMPISVSFHYRDRSVGMLGEPYISTGMIKNGKLNGAFLFYVARQDNLSPNFKVREFACHCGCRTFQIDPILIHKLEQLRALAGHRKIRVNSGYRCPANNARVGGKEESQHVYGKAADIVIEGLTVQQMKDLAEKVGFWGIGIYPTKGFIHVDTRSGHARWSGK